MRELSPPILAELGRALVERVMVLNLWTAALLGGALLLDRLLARSTRAGWRIALYAPIALRIVLPLDWRIGPPHAAIGSVVVAPLLRVGAAVPDTSRAPTGYVLVAALYAIVVLMLAVRAVVSRGRLARATARAHAREPFVSIACPVVEHEELGPMLVGLVSPRLVLPRRLFAAGAEEGLRWVLAHEAAHLRRRDGWLVAAMELLAIVSWPILPVWVAIARVRRLIELACDEAAVEGAGSGERSRYGHVLLDVADWGGLEVAPTAELHFGSALRGRIEALAWRRRWPAGAQALALAAAPVAMLVACGAAGTGPLDEDGEGAGRGYEFVPDDTTNAGPASERGAAAGTTERGHLPPEVIQAVVRKHFGAYKTCYERGLERNPRLAGDVRIAYVIDESGATRGAKDDGSTLPDAEVIGCVVDAFSAVKYPAPERGSVSVVYPIVFAP